MRACNSTPGLCASPGDSIGGGWRRSGRRRVQPARQRPAAGAGGSPRGSLADASRSRVRAEPGRSPGASLAGGPWAAAGRGGRRRGGPPVRCARRRGAPPTRSGAREPGSWARRRLGGCCAPAPRAAAPGSPPRPRPGHARRRPTMTAPWRRLRSLVWEYWAGLLVCTFWIPDSRGMPHVIRIGKGSPEPGVSVRPGGDGNGGPLNAIPRDFPNLSGLPRQGDHQELVPVRTKFQSRGHGPYLLGRRQPGGGGRGRGALGALLGGQTWWSVAKRSSANPSRGSVSRRLPARPAGDGVLGPGFSAEREPWGRRQLLFAPRSPRAPRPRLGHGSSAAAGTQCTASHDGGSLSPLPLAAHSAPWRGAGEGQPPAVVPAVPLGRDLSPSWGSAATKPARCSERRRPEGCECF